VRVRGRVCEWLIIKEKSSHGTACDVSTSSVNAADLYGFINGQLRRALAATAAAAGSLSVA